MCMIAILPAGVALSKEQVLDIMLFADDGLGVMYCGSHGLVVGRKMLRNPMRVWQWLSSLPIEVERFIHFRRTTRGDTHRDNLHPFVFHNVRFGLMHNGTLPDSLVPFDLPDGISDTSYFVRRYLHRMPVAALTSTPFWDLVGAAAEDDRIVCLDGKTGVSYFTNRWGWYTGKHGIVISNNYAFKDEALWGVKKRKPVNVNWRSPLGERTLLDYSNEITKGAEKLTGQPTLDGVNHESSKTVVVAEPRQASNKKGDEASPEQR